MYHHIAIAHRHPAIGLPAHVGETLFMIGDPCHHAFEIQSGIVRAVDHSRNGDRQVMAFFFAGDIIGLPLDDKHRYTCEAVSDVRYTPYIRNSQRNCDRDERDRGNGLLSDIWREERRFLARSLILGRVGILARMAAFLTSVAPKLRRSEGALEVPLPQTDIASYLGTSPETVCRTLRQLRKMGAISMRGRGRIAILSAETLKAIAEGSCASFA